jgi:hypothetical protein
MMPINGLFRGATAHFKVQYLTVGITENPEQPFLTHATFEPWYGMVLRGGFPHALKPYIVYCTTPLNFQLSRHTLAVPAQCTAYLPKNSGI